MKNIFTLLYILLALSSTTIAQGYIINNYVITCELSNDNYFDINEVITVTFNEERRGIIRDIPMKINVEGKNQKIGLSNVIVKGYNHKVLREGNLSKIRIGNADEYITGEHTYNISYRVKNAYIYADDHIAFQYNLISDWDTSIEKMKYKIIFPDDLDIDDDDFRIMTGDLGETNRHTTIRKTGNQLVGQAMTKINERQNVTIAVRLPADYMDIPTELLPLHKRDKWWLAPIGLLLLLINFFRGKRKINPQLSSVVAIEDEHFPPSEFSPAMVGAYYDYKVNTEDIIALLPYWAEKSYIKIMSGDGDLYFKKLIPLDEDSPEYQQVIFNNIFKEGDIIILSELKNKLYKYTSQAKSLLNKELSGKHLYDEDYLSIFRSRWWIPLGILLILSAIALIISGMVITGICSIVIAIAMFIMYGMEPKKSELGIRIHRHLEGLKQFLVKSPEEATGQLLNKYPTYFEHIYPYAIALGIDQTWVNKMKEYEVNTPHWYSYHDHTHVNTRPSFNDFSKDFSVPEIKSVFTSYPASSSGSASGGGFSGGGGAGGGFGGGGSSW
jgi:uncharacterized membrane protein YgcG